MLWALQALGEATGIHGDGRIFFLKLPPFGKGASFFFLLLPPFVKGSSFSFLITVLLCVLACQVLCKLFQQLVFFSTHFCCYFCKLFLRFQPSKMKEDSCNPFCSHVAVYQSIEVCCVYLRFVLDQLQQCLPQRTWVDLTCGGKIQQSFQQRQAMH